MKAMKHCANINGYDNEYSDLDHCIRNNVTMEVVSMEYYPVSQCIPREFPTNSSSSWNSKRYHGIPWEI